MSHVIPSTIDVDDKQHDVPENLARFALLVNKDIAAAPATISDMNQSDLLERMVEAADELSESITYEDGKRDVIAHAVKLGRLAYLSALKYCGEVKLGS